MLDTLCILFYTGYFKWADGSYNAFPQNTSRIEIKTERFRTLLLKTKNNIWFGNVNGKIFYGSFIKYRENICELASQERLPEEAYKLYSILEE